MDRLTFEGNFCDIAKCESVPGGSWCETGVCSQRKVWERLKEYEDAEEKGLLVWRNEGAVTMGRPIDMGKSETPYALYEKAGDKWLVSFILILYIKNPGLRKLLCECMEDWGIPEEVTRNLPGSYDDLPDELRLIFEEAERRRSKGKKEGQNGQTD